jgi:hypothetical protein
MIGYNSFTEREINDFSDDWGQFMTTEFITNDVGIGSNLLETFEDSRISLRTSSSETEENSSNFTSGR